MDFNTDQVVNGAKSMLKWILGIIAGLCTAGISVLFLIAMIVGFVFSQSPVAIVCLILCAVFGVVSYQFFRFAGRSRQKQQMAAKLQEYQSIEKGVEYFAVSDLASACGENVSTTRSNLKKMKAFGMLPGVTFDRSMTTVLLTDHARTLYRQAMESYQQRKLQEQMNAAHVKVGNGQPLQAHQAMPQNKSSEDKTVLRSDAKGAKAVRQASDGAANTDARVQAVLQSGYSYSRKIREINDMIPDTDGMSIKLYRLENVVSGIFREVEHNPKQARRTRKLTDYYLPTIMKLLSDYMEIQNKPYRSPEDIKTQGEIESAVDQTSDAFEKLYSKMTQINTMDIESDISVMKRMMEQDGLKQSDKVGLH